jgi:hypothetical protein
MRVAGAFVVWLAMAALPSGAAAAAFEVAPPLPGAELAQDTVRSDVAASTRRSGFVLVWAALIGGGERTRVYARRLDRDGRPASEPVVIGSSGPSGSADEPRLAYDLAADRFLVTWSSRGVNGDGGGAVRTRLLDGVGRPLGTSTRVSGANLRGAESPVVAFEPVSRRYAVSWSDGGAMHVRLLDRGGRPRERVRLTAPGAGVMALAANPRLRSFLVAWVDDRPRIETVVTRVLSPSGRPGPSGTVRLGSPPRTRSISVEHLDLSYDSRRGRFVLARTQDHDYRRGGEWSELLVRRLDSGGRSIGGDLEITSEPGPYDRVYELRIAYDRGSDSHQAVWTRFQMGSGPACSTSTVDRRAVTGGWRRAPSQRALFGPIGRQPQSFCDNHPGWPALAPAGGGRWLFVWSSPPFLVGDVPAP